MPTSLARGNFDIQTDGAHQLLDTLDESKSSLFRTMIKQKSSPSLRTIIGKCLFYLWDGIEFFELSSHQLERVKSKENSWRDKLCSEQWVFGAILAFFVIVYVVFTQLQDIGQIKQIEMSLEDRPELYFEMSTFLRAVGLAWFKAEDVIKSIQQYQDANINNTDAA